MFPLQLWYGIAKLGSDVAISTYTCQNDLRTTLLQPRPTALGAVRGSRCAPRTLTSNSGLSLFPSWRAVFSFLCFYPICLYTAEISYISLGSCHTSLVSSIQEHFLSFLYCYFRWLSERAGIRLYLLCCLTWKVLSHNPSIPFSGHNFLYGNSGALPRCLNVSYDTVEMMSLTCGI